MHQRMTHALHFKALFHVSAKRCAIVPPHVLKHLTTAPGANDRQRALAYNTLQAMDDVRRSAEAVGRSALGSHRVPALTGEGAKTEPPILIPSYVFADIAKAKGVPQRTKDRIKLSTEKQTALKPSNRPVPKHLFRVVRDGHQSNVKSGNVVIASIDERESSADQGANRIFDYYGQVFEFFFDVYGRNSIDDKGFNLIATAHWDDDNGKTPGYMNAFWDPRTAEWYFGDGDGNVFDDFTKSLDVVGHEYAHALTQFTANLPYQFQAGALNEHFSDVFGSLVKQYYHAKGPQKAEDADWLIGCGIFLNDGAPALRSMEAPGTAYDWPEFIGKDPQPADMDGFQDLPMDNDNGGVHIFSGIPNRAFYLAAIGFGGHAWDKAGKVWYETLIDPEWNAFFNPEKVSLRNLERNSKNAFVLLANLTCEHAERLLGREGTQVVKQAWRAVKVLPAPAQARL